MMRTFAVAFLAFVVYADATLLRGSYNEALRRLQSGDCDPIDSPIWDMIAIRNGLDPAVWAEKLYTSCVNNASGDLKSETIYSGCWSSGGK